MKKSRTGLNTACVAALLMLGTSTSIAQAELEEVTVTAQRRAERIQDVPISVNALSAQTLQDAGISDLIQLNQVVPGLNIAMGGNGVLTPFLRGIGNSISTVGNEASTAVYVDDVYISRLTAAVLQLADIDQVQVIKGPQGTLFGRNASGGLINIVTRTPSLENRQLEATIGYGNYNTTTEKLYVSFPITSTLAGDFSAYNSNQNHGWGRNVASGGEAGFDDPTVLRSKWLFAPTDALRITAAISFVDDWNDIGQPENAVAGTTIGFPTFLTLPPYNQPVQQFAPAPGYYDSNSYDNHRALNEAYGGYVRVDYTMPFAKFSSISSWNKVHEDSHTDGSNVPVDTYDYELISNVRTATQEFQLSSAPGGPVDWIGGLYYLNELAGYEPVAIRGAGLAVGILGGALGATLPAGSTVGLYGAQRLKDYAAYGQATIHLPLATDLTLGGRYTVDDLQGSGSIQIGIPGIFTGPAGAPKSDSTRFKKPTYKVGLAHHLSRDHMLYASVSRGFKAGTYNTLPLSLPPARPEIVQAYELGIKSTFMDDRLQLNAAVFYNWITDPQIQEIVNHLVFLANAKSAKTQGVDFDGEFAIAPGLVARFGAEYLEARYVSFENAPFYPLLSGPPYGIGAAEPRDASGNYLVNAPRVTANAGLNYAFESGLGGFNFNTNLSYNSGFYWQPDNQIKQPSYKLLDASAEYSPPGQRNWKVRLWGKNITGTRYAIISQEFAGQGVFYAPGAPATYGIELRWTLE